MDPSGLADSDPFDVYDAEVARLGRYFSSLTERDWERPSRCEGWRVRDVLGHLAGEEAYNHACLNDDLDAFFAEIRGRGVEGFGDFNEWCVRQRADMPVERVLDEWRTGSAETRGRMRALGADARLSTSAGPYPVGLQALHYASETATHADDVGTPVDATDERVRTAWRARFGRVALEEAGSQVEVTERDGAYHVRLGDAEVELSERDFVEATVARLPEEHPLPASFRDALVCLA